MVVNGSENLSSVTPFWDKDMEALYFTVLDVQTKILPAICVVGFVTNFLSLLVFLQPTLRGLSCSVYLAAKAVADFIFLLTVFIIWLPRIDMNAFHYSGICQLVIFFSYLTAFISIWLAVVLTVENLLCFVRPWYVQRSCNTYSAITLTFTIVLLGIMLYHFSLWNNGVHLSQKRNESSSNISKDTTQEELIQSATYNETSTEGNMNKPKIIYSFQQIDIVISNLTTENASKYNTSTNYEQRCLPLDEFNYIMVAMTYIDSLVTLFIPLLILIVDNAIIVFLAFRSSRKRIRLCEKKGNYQLPGTHLSQSGQASSSLKTQASKFLFAVSMTTLLFHLPSHMIRLRLLLFGFTATEILLQRIFETLYYAHYAIGFFVYILFGKNFRKVFVQLLLRKSS